MKFALIVAFALALMEPAPAQDSAAPGISTADRAEAYYYYCLARKHEMEMATEQALSNYQLAADKDPEAAYPLVAMAELYLRTRQSDKALATVKSALAREDDVAAAYRLEGGIYFTALRNGGDESVAELAIAGFRNVVRLEPRDVASRSSLARLLLAQGRPQEASEHLEEVIRLRPSAYYELFLLAQVRRAEGDAEQAHSLLEQSLRIEPRQPDVREQLVEILREENDFASIIEIFEKAIADSPEDLTLRAQLAEALANGDQLERAAEQFEVILSEDPSNLTGKMGLAMVSRDLGRLERSEELFQEVVAERPNNVAARYNLAGVYEMRREHQAAADQWSGLLEMSDDAYEVERRAEFGARLGFALLELHQAEASVEAFRMARSHAEDDPRFGGFLVQGLVGAKRADEAQTVLNRELERFPRERSLRVLKVRVLDALGKHDEAIASALEMSNENPNNLGLTSAVVEAYQSQERFADAEAFVRKRLDELSGGEEQDGSQASLSFLLGAALERQQKFSLAEVEFKKVLALNPDSAPALNYLGYMLADQAVRLDESVGYLLKAVELDPYNGAYLDSLGWVYFKLGKLDLAEQHLLEAIKRLRLTGVVYDHLGDLYFKKGERQQALQYWEKALEQDDEEVKQELVTEKIERLRDQDK